MPRVLSEEDGSTMTPEDVQAYFTHSDGSYQFARWGRAIAPVIFGVDEDSLQVLKGALEAVVVFAQHNLTDVDPEIGANLMVFFIRDWQELADTPKLDEMIPDLSDLVERLKQANANQYRLFRFDEQGAIKACFVFLRMDEALAALPAESLALSQMVQAMLIWTEGAFTKVSPLARISESGGLILRPEIAELIRAAYDPRMPDSAHDTSHAIRLFARMDIEK